MKWSFVIQQKLKAALLLTSIMLLITLSTFISRSNIRAIEKDFSSIYQDRLLPAVDFVYLSENLYSKRLLLEEHLRVGETVTSEATRMRLSQYNHRVDSLIQVVEKTYLVKEESVSLQALRKDVAAYAGLEQTILQLSESNRKEAGTKLFSGEGGAIFQRVITHLNELTRIQSVIGRELVKDSRGESSMFNLISSMQIAIAIIIGALILGLIHSSKIVRQDSKSFPLN